MKSTMSLTSHLKFKMQSERSAALALDKAAQAVRKEGVEALADVKSGF